MKKIVKMGISAISAAAVAVVGYHGKKIYDKKKSKSMEINQDDTTNEMTEVSAAEVSTNDAE